MGNMISQETGKTGIDTVGCHKGFVPVVFGHDIKCRQKCKDCRTASGLCLVRVIQ
jgi:hypothetical protein